MAVQVAVVISGTTKEGQQVFYTGRAGGAFVSRNRSNAFVYGAERAARKVELLNEMTALHGITFEVAQ